MTPTQPSGSTHDPLRKAEHERRIASLDAFFAAYEKEHGAITDSEMDEAMRRARGRAVVVHCKENRRSL